jgi:pimeloyl-ACP methyl ester carboxylesterase
MVALAVFVLYVLLMTVGGVPDRVLLWSSTRPIDAGGAVRREVGYRAGRLNAWTARSPAVGRESEPAAFVLEFTGRGTRAEQIATFVANRWKRYPVEVWVMNYPGYGTSQGGAHLRLIPPAALATYDALAKVAAGRPIFLEANGLGTAPALYVAARRRVAGLVLQDPPPLRRLILRRYGWWNAWLIAGPVALAVPAELDSLANASNIDVPAVFLSAEQDTVVPPAYQRLILSAYRGPKRVITMPHTAHLDSVTGKPEEQLADGIDWLWRAAFPPNRF